MKFACLANTRPETVFEISQILHVAQAMYEKDITKHYKRSNKAVEYLHDHKASIRTR